MSAVFTSCRDHDLPFRDKCTNSTARTPSDAREYGLIAKTKTLHLPEENAGFINRLTIFKYLYLRLHYFYLRFLHTYGFLQPDVLLDHFEFVF